MASEEVPSCGQVQLQQGKFDFAIMVSDKKRFIKIPCHRSVAEAHMTKIAEVADPYQPIVTIIMPSHLLPSAVELVQYMYLRDIELVTDREKVADVAAIVGMQHGFYPIRMGRGKRTPVTITKVVFDETDESFLGVQEFAADIKYGSV